MMVAHVFAYGCLVTFLRLVPVAVLGSPRSTHDFAVAVRLLVLRLRSCAVTRLPLCTRGAHHAHYMFATATAFGSDTHALPHTLPDCRTFGFRAHTLHRTVLPTLCGYGLPAHHFTYGRWLRMRLRSHLGLPHYITALPPLAPAHTCLVRDTRFLPAVFFACGLLRLLVRAAHTAHTRTPLYTVLPLRL